MEIVGCRLDLVNGSTALEQHVAGSWLVGVRVVACSYVEQGSCQYAGVIQCHRADINVRHSCGWVLGVLSLCYGGPFRFTVQNRENCHQTGNLSC